MTMGLCVNLNAGQACSQESVGVKPRELEEPHLLTTLAFIGTPQTSRCCQWLASSCFALSFPEGVKRERNQKWNGSGKRRVGPFSFRLACLFFQFFLCHTTVEDGRNPRFSFLRVRDGDWVTLLAASAHLLHCYKVLKESRREPAIALKIQ
jgi:hypothetical protein